VGSQDGKLYAFDAAGNTNCSGTPKSCTPLWTASTATQQPGNIAGPPTVANGVVYVVALAGMYAFDAAGTTNCSGSPKTCAPLWTTSTSGVDENIGIAPAVANGVVYV